MQNNRPISAFLPGIFLALCCCFISNLSAQSSMLVTEGLSIRNDFGYEIIGRLRDNILLFRDKYDQFEIQAYDAQMRPSWNRELDDLDRRGVQVLATVSSKNDFSIVHKVRKRGRTVLRIHKYDPGANMIDSVTLKNYGDRVFTPPILETISSEDRNCFIVYNTAERDKLEITCFRVDKMQVLWDETVILEDNLSENSRPLLALSNDGALYLVTERNNRRGKVEDHNFHILRISASGDNTFIVPTPDFLTSSVKFIFDNQNRRLVAAGLYADKNRDRANGTFFLSLNATDTKPTLHFEAFDDKFISILRQKDVEDDTRGIGDATVGQLILRQDGGVLMIAERSHEIQRGSNVSGRFSRDVGRMIVDYYFDDVFAVAIQPDGKTQWRTVLHKKQYSQDDEGTFSSYFLFRNTDKLRVLFNDEIKYDNTCSEYVVSPAGGFDRNSLLSTAGQNLRLRYRDAMQISASECIVPSEFRNKLRLVLLRF